MTQSGGIPLATPITSIFKIITPIDVNFFNKFVKDNQKISLTKVLTDQTQTQTGSQENKNHDLFKSKKILATAKNIKRNKIVIHEDIENAENSLENANYNSNESEKEDLPEKLAHSSTILFLKEKEKSEHAQGLLKKIEILSIYTAGSKLDVYQERKRHNEMSESVDKGTLLDYKHS